LLERVGLQVPRGGVGRIGEHDVADHLDDPAVVALVERRPRLVQQRVGAAGELDVAAARLGRWQPPEVGTGCRRTSDR
jgi:hypothetical protein